MRKWWGFSIPWKSRGQPDSTSFVITSGKEQTKPLTVWLQSSQVCSCYYELLILLQVSGRGKDNDVTLKHSLFSSLYLEFAILTCAQQVIHAPWASPSQQHNGRRCHVVLFPRSTAVGTLPMWNRALCAQKTFFTKRWVRGLPLSSR